MKFNKMSLKWGEGGLSFFLRAVALCVAAVLSFAARADVITNIWQGADGAAWGTPANWSENHVPDGTEALEVRMIYGTSVILR